MAPFFKNFSWACMTPKYRSYISMRLRNAPHIPPPPRRLSHRLCYCSWLWNLRYGAPKPITWQMTFSFPIRPWMPIVVVLLLVLVIIFVVLNFCKQSMLGKPTAMCVRWTVDSVGAEFLLVMDAWAMRVRWTVDSDGAEFRINLKSKATFLRCVAFALPVFGNATQTLRCSLDCCTVCHGGSNIKVNRIWMLY